MTLKNGIILLKKCRPINLFTIIILQCFIYYFLFYTIIGSTSIDLRISLGDLLLLTLDLALIMAAGYLINDIYDLETDQHHNHKESLTETGLPLSFFYKSYWVISLLGMCLTLYLANKYNEWGLSILYPIGSGLLYIYARFLKSSILWGNLLIAVLCGFPAVMLYLAESPAVLKLQSQSIQTYEHFISILTFYLVFACISTLIREIIKDLEDKDADLSAGIKSFANSTPHKIVQGFCTILMSCFLGIQLYFCNYLFMQDSYLALLFFIICIIPLTGFGWIKFYKAKTSEDYRGISRIYKGIILSGIVLLAFIQ